MLKISVLTIIFWFSVQTVSADSANNLTYCIPKSTINLNPFRPITDGKDLAYLTLLKSLISTDPSETGILEAFNFSPDGRSFTGRVSKGLRWPDGKRVTAQDIAFNIARELVDRPLGQRVSIEGTEKIKAIDWLSQKYSGIQLIDDLNFKIRFHSSIENLTGVLLEAFSSNSRHNRFWFAELHNNNLKDGPAVLFKNDQKDNLLKIGSDFISIKSDETCRGSDFIYGSNPDNNKLYDERRSSTASTTTLQLNTKRLSVAERKSLASWIRHSFFKDGPSFGFEFEKSFFSRSENGYADVEWPESATLIKFPKRKIKIGFESPDQAMVIRKTGFPNDIAFDLISLPTAESDLDAQLLVANMSKGRQIVLQDISKWPHVADMLVNAPETRKSLGVIAARSASTVPVDSSTLHAFETASLKEFAFAPVVRRYPKVLSKKSLSVCLAWTPHGELRFLTKAACKQND